MNQRTAFALLAIAQVSVAINVVTSKDALLIIPTYTFCGLRFLISTFLLGSMLFLSKTPVRDRRHPSPSLSKKDQLSLFGQAATGGFLFNILFYFGLDYTTASSAGTIAATLPVFIAILAVVILREHMSKAKWFAIGLSMVGIAILASDNLSSADSISGSWRGDGLILLAMIPEAFYSIIARGLSKRVTPLGSAFITNLLTLALLVPFMIPGWDQTMALMTNRIVWQIILAGLTSLVFFWAWAAGLETVPASTAALFGGLMPVATTILAIVFLDETLLTSNLLGMVLIIGAVFFGRKRPSPEPGHM